MKRKINFAKTKTEGKPSVLLQGFETSGAIILIILLCVSVYGLIKYHYALTFIKTQSEKLEGAGDVKLVSITAAPYKLNLGQKITQETIKNYLLKIGYTQSENNQPATFKNEDNELFIYSRFSEFPDLLISFQKERISALKNLKTESVLPKSEIEPILLNQYLPFSQTEIGAVINEEVKFGRDVANTTFLDSLLVVENRNFFSELNGISWKGIVRALREQGVCTAGKTFGYECKQKSGASTITSQVVKNLFLTNEKTFSRKYEELWLTIALEKYLNSKERILELYLNNIVISEALVKDSPARQIVGFAAAAKYLYGKKLSELSPNEAVTLACLVKMPNKFLKRENGKLINYDRLLIRRNEYLVALHTVYPEKYSLETVNQAISEEIKFKFDWEQESLDKASATFAAYAEKNAEQLIKESNLSFKSEIIRIQTLADQNLLLAMHEVLRKRLPDFAKKVDSTSEDLEASGSIVIYDAGKGNFLSINSLDFADGQLHLSRHAFDSSGQMMSLIKPFIVGFGLQKNKVKLSDRISPPECRTSIWTPNENKLETRTLGQHLVASNNLAPLCVLQKVGLDNFGDWWKQITGKESANNFRVANGLTSETNLSAVKVASLYGMFANQGRIFDGTTITNIFAGNQPTKIPLNEYQAISPEVAKSVANQLRGVVDEDSPDGNFGTAGTLLGDAGISGKKSKIWGKTGSGTNDYWIALGNGKIVIVVRLTAYKKSGGNINTQNVYASQTAAVVAQEVLSKINSINPELLKD